jgi:hypothetical protein
MGFVRDAGGRFQTAMPCLTDTTPPMVINETMKIARGLSVPDI